MISVITPVYNGEKFIKSCIQVVIDQAYSDLEHIIVDGGSSDRTVEIVQQYAEKYPHIRWLSEKDKGQSDAMNKGIAMAKGEILAILNVDDYYEPNVLRRVAELFKTLPEPSLLVGNCNVWGDAGELKVINKPKRLKLSDLLLGHRVNPFPVNPAAYFYHTSLHQKIGPYEVDDHYSMDVDFLLRAVQAAKVKYVNETWGNHRQIEGTKTVDDLRSGQNKIRVKALMELYRKDLPVVLRAWVSFMYSFHENRFKVEYFLQNPHRILPIFQKKLVKN